MSGLADDPIVAGGVATDALDQRRSADVVGIDGDVVHALVHGVVPWPRADRLIDAVHREIDGS
jgi:hypothetical protein